MRAAIRPLLTVTVLALLATACGLFAPASTSQCTVSSDCPALHICAHGRCLPASDLGDGGAGDTAVSDAIALDRPRLDAVTDRTGVVDGSAPDAAANDLVSDRRYSDGVVAADIAAVDVAAVDAAAVDGVAIDVVADAAPPDTSPPDSAQPDTVDAADPCGNEQSDPGEVCDGEDGCDTDCQPLSGYGCGRDGMDTVQCYPIFGAGAPSHVAGHADPAKLLSLYVGAGFSTANTDTNASSITIGGTEIPVTPMTQSNGPELLVIYLRALTVAGNLRISGSRIPVFVVYGDAHISGNIDVGAAGSTPGPGGDGYCQLSLGSDGSSSDNCGGGGGGGGNLTAGGNGGSFGAGGGSAGSVLDPSAVILLGGCRGGAGSFAQPSGGTGAPGGGGGGAIQISVAGTLEVLGAIYADGAGGAGGAIANIGGGGGGGSGGTIFIEARQINADSARFLLGGGGGGGGANLATGGVSGFTGRNGGFGGAGAVGRNGGDGSTSSAAPGNDGVDGNQNSGIGGGGGGGGFGKLVTVTLPTP